MVRIFLIIVLSVLSLVGCGPLINRPVEFLPFSYQPGYAVTQFPVRWEVRTSAPPNAKTSTVTMPVGAAPVFIPIGGANVPPAQLLSEEDQRQIFRMLKNVLGETPESSCTAVVVFDDPAYQFHYHQYWVTVNFSVSDGQNDLLQKSERFWSAENMTTGQKWNTHPQDGKQALAKQILDKFGAFVNSSIGELSACAPISS